MEHKSEESSGKQPGNSPSKQGSKEQNSSDDKNENKPTSSLTRSESNGKTEKNEQRLGIQAIPSDKQKIEVLEHKYPTLGAVGSSKVSVTMSPTKRKYTETHIVALEKIEPGEKQLKVEEPRPTPSEAGVRLQGSPKHSSTMSEISVEAGAVIQGSPKLSPTMRETSVKTGALIQGSPKRSPTIPGTLAAAGSIIQGFPKHSPAVPGTSAAGGKLQGSPKRSPTIPGTSAAAAGGIIQGSPENTPMIPETSVATGDIQGSPKHMPMIPGTSAVAGDTMQRSPMRSPTKRTYQERQQSFNVDELVEKRLREESGYQSDSALDLRKDFKKQIPCSTQSHELDCEPTSSNKIADSSEKRGETKSTQSSLSCDSGASEVTSSDGGEADVSSTSKENVSSTTSGTVPSTQGQGRQVQNVAEKNEKRKSPKTSPQHSSARPREAASGSRSVEYIEVSLPKFSPSKWFYGGPTIRRISPQRASPSEPGGFKVPPPPPPIEERERPAAKITNLFEGFMSLVEDCHAIVTAEHVREQMRREQEEIIRRERQQAEIFARAKAQAAETTKKLREKEARNKAGDIKSGTADSRTNTEGDEAIAGPSTSGLCPAVSSGEVEAEALDEHESPSVNPIIKGAEPIAGSKNLPAASTSMHDENANIMVGGFSRSICEDDNLNKSEPCTAETSQEVTKDNVRQSASNVVEQRPQETPRNPEYIPLQQLVPQINEISLYDSLENIEIADSEQEDDDVDLEKDDVDLETLEIDLEKLEDNE